MAPSKLLRPAGDRVKTDKRDARHLARLLHLDEYTSVAVPTIGQESARDLVRAREQCRADLMRSRHRVSKLLLRHAILYSGGTAWTGTHLRWLQSTDVREELLSASGQPSLVAYQACLERSSTPKLVVTASPVEDGVDITPYSLRLGQMTVAGDTDAKGSHGRGA